MCSNVAVIIITGVKTNDPNFIENIRRENDVVSADILAHFCKLNVVGYNTLITKENLLFC